MMPISNPAFLRKSRLPVLAAVLAAVLLPGGTSRSQAGRSQAGDPVVQLAALNLQEQALLARMDANRGQLSRLMMALALFRRDPPPPLLVSPEDARSAVRAAILVRAVVPELKARAADLTAQSREIQTLRRQAASASAGRFSRDSALAEQKPLPSDPLGALGGDGAAPVVIERDLKLSWPITGKRVRAFGEDEGPGTSRGLVIRSAPGQNVRSPADGIVAFSGAMPDWGQVVILRADATPYYIVLAGLDQSVVQRGAVVRTGTQLGRMARGGDGDLDLSIEVREGSQVHDPARWLR